MNIRTRRLEKHFQGNMWRCVVVYRTTFSAKLKVRCGGRWGIEPGTYSGSELTPQPVQASIAQIQNEIFISLCNKYFGLLFFFNILDFSGRDLISPDQEKEREGKM